MGTGPDASLGYEALVHDTRVPDAAGDGEGALTSLEFTSGTQLADVIAALVRVFAEDPALDSVLLAPDGRPVGSTARVRFEQQVPGGDEDDQESALRGGLGAGDHGVLPGTATRFTAYRYRCRQCGRTVYRIAADLEPPSCPVAGHGAMRMVP